VRQDTPRWSNSAILEALTNFIGRPSFLPARFAVRLALAFRNAHRRCFRRVEPRGLQVYDGGVSKGCFADACKS
jgi:hypothetical protein